MKRICLITFISLFVSIFSKSQITITSSYVTNTIIFSTGDTYITFAIRNNNSYPIVITNMTGLQANLYTDNTYNLWYSSTSLVGAPTIGSPAWTPITSSPFPLNTSTYDYVTPFNCIGFTIPSNTTYRFALRSNKGTCVAGGVTPNIFSAGGVDLLVGDNVSLGGQVGYFGWQNVGNSGTPYFFDGSISFATVNLYNDIEVRKINLPSTACNSTTNNIGAQICNKSTKIWNFATNNVNVGFNISGPNGTFTPSATISTGSLAPCGCNNVTVSSDISAQGMYTVTATASAAITELTLANNSKTDSIRNFKPTVNSNESICQFTNPNGFSGFIGNGCSVSPNKTAVVNCTVATTMPVDGTDDATASQFATGILPNLPDGAVIVSASLLIDNLNTASGSLSNQCRFNIYGPNPNNAANPFYPGYAGNPLNFGVPNFEYSVPIPGTVINNMYSALGGGGTFYIGYWETLSNTVGADLSLNAQTYPTTAKLTITYYINPITKWYTASSGGNSIYNGNPFNPFVVPGSGITNTNTVTSATFYAACSADTNCRVPVTVSILPSPIVVQDSIMTCEAPVGTGTASFDLNTISLNVSNNNTNATVNYYQDNGLASLISTPGSYVSPTAYIFSKVSVANGCYSSDTVYLQVHTTPYFIQDPYSKEVCFPGTVNVADMISPSSTSPAGTDTLYFADPACTIPFLGANNVVSSATVYIVFKTNTVPSCSDTAVATVTVGIPDGSIVNQSNFNNSICGNITPVIETITDGSSKNFLNGTCQYLIGVQDISNGTSLGSTTVEETIDCTVQYHNGQPYLNRHFKISPTNQDSAVVTLYILQDDIDMYNQETSINNWPTIVPNVNLSITKVDNGDLNDPNHIPTLIPLSAINCVYNPSTTVWTITFPVSSFSYFYIHSTNPINAPLPVKLTSFKGRKQQDHSLLEWSISMAINASHFTVERSKEGKLFSEISNPIPIAYHTDNSLVKDYQFVDEQPQSGHNYYRLKMTDVDQKNNFSDVIDIYYGDGSVVKVYPNPTHDLLQIDLDVIKSGSYVIQLMDATGRMVKQMDVTALEGINQFTMNLEDLPNGIFNLKVSNNKSLRYTQLIRKL